jgi:multicomponent Na+:H+ antiporter subunit C
MELLLALLVGLLYAAGFYLILRRSAFKLLLGLILLGHAVHLLIFTSSGLTRGLSPLIPAGLSVPAGMTADPLPQALILTAIVISFGVAAFALVLILRVTEEAGTDDLDEMRFTERSQ